MKKWLDMFIRPAFDFKEREEEAPDENSFFPSRYLDGGLCQIRILIRDEEGDRFYPFRWIVLVQAEREAEFGLVRIQLLTNVVFSERARETCSDCWEAR